MLSLKCVNCGEEDDAFSGMKELHDALVKLMNINDKKQHMSFLTSVIEERQVPSLFPNPRFSTEEN
jgi:hypothetical protein